MAVRRTALRRYDEPRAIRFPSIPGTPTTRPGTSDGPRGLPCYGCGLSRLLTSTILPDRFGGARGRNRMPGQRGFSSTLLRLAVALAGLGGCATKPGKQEDPGAANLRKIAQAYELATDLRRRPPRSAEEL